MLYRFLLIVLVLDSFVLIGTILLQAGKGTGLAANFGGASSSPDAFIGIHQAGNILTQATWWCAGIFLALAFIMQVMSTHSRVPRSVLEGAVANPPAQAAPAPNQTSPAPATAVPLEPAPKTTTPQNAAPAAAAKSGAATAPAPSPTKR